MKKIVTLLGLCVLSFACNSEDPDTVNDPLNDDVNIENKVLLLQVDFETNTFEGGKELIFPEASEFTISHIYNSPGDFGDITLKYAEVDQTLFAGGIVWMGLGEMTFPESIDPADGFQTIENAVPQPAEDGFSIVNYGPEFEFQDQPNYDAIWDAVENLVAVEDYRNSNPDAKVHLFLYTPSVGIGNPADWNWFVILKN